MKIEIKSNEQAKASAELGKRSGNVKIENIKLGRFKNGRQGVEPPSNNGWVRSRYELGTVLGLLQGLCDARVSSPARAELSDTPCLRSLVSDWDQDRDAGLCPTLPPPGLSRARDSNSHSPEGQQR